MSALKDLIQKQLDQYQSKTEQDEENALKEITQEIALYALALSGFFQFAAFQGGTCLRIVHGLDRFSEDLDFSLRKAGNFDLNPFLEKTASLMKSYGYQLEIATGGPVDKTVQSKFLKDDSIKKIITFKHLRDLRKKLQIKFEVDTNPPDHAKDEVKFVEFPTDYSVLCHDLTTLFAGKIHALLCRKYSKGRDWYDFNWYISQKIAPNYTFLGAALQQQGPWQGKTLLINSQWVKDKLSEKIDFLDWKKIINDVTPFLKAEKKGEVETLWSKDFFTSKKNKLL